MAKLVKLAVVLIFIGFFCNFTVGAVGATPEETSEDIELVILLTIDGCRADKLVEANTPNLDSLAAEGSVALYCITVFYSYTSRAHASLLTGAYYEVHQYDEGGDPMAETICEAFEEAGERTAFIDGKGGRILGLERGVSYPAIDVDYRKLENPDNLVIAKAISILEENDPTFLFALLPKVDSTGHKYGHMSTEYLSEIERADAAIGVLVGWLKEQGMYESTLLVVTADHGMTGMDHGDGTIPGNRLIPLILCGPGVMENGRIYSAEIIDIAPTIAGLFGIEPPQNAGGATLTFVQVQVLSPLSPVSGVVLGEDPVFQWSEIQDVTYELMVDNDLDFSSPEINPTGLTTSTYSDQLADGGYVWRVRAVGNDGEIVAESPVWVFEVDTVPPYLTVRKLPEKADSPSLSISGITEPLLRARIYIDGTLADEATANEDTGRFAFLVTLNEGVNSITVEAVDLAGNVSQTSAQVTYGDAEPEMPKEIIWAVAVLVMAVVVAVVVWKVRK